MPKPPRLQYKSAAGGAQQANMQIKAADPGASTILSADDTSGIVEALVSITGVVDRQKDIIVPGAYTRTLKALKPNGHRYHDMTRKVAKTLVAEEWMPGDSRLPEFLADGVTPWPKAAGALYIKGQYNLGTEDGRNAYADAKFFGPEGQWSIGYAPHGPGGAVKRKDGIRELRDIDLFEWSDVSHGAAPWTTTLGVKDAFGEDDEPVDGDEPAGFVSDLEGKFNPNHVAAGSATGGQFATASGGDNSKPAAGGPNSANGLPEGWLGDVLKGDSRYVKPKGGGGDDAAKQSRSAEMDMRDAIDGALDKERADEKKRRLDADRKISAAEGDEKRSLQAAEKERQRNWQESFDEVVAQEKARRRAWNAEHRNRTAGKSRTSDDEILFSTEVPIGADGPDGVEVKYLDALVGSFEELQQRLRVAAEDWYQLHQMDGYDEDGDPDHDGPVPSELYANIVGTWPDRCVVCFYGRGSGREHYEFPYRRQGDEVVLGEPRMVEIMSTVVPKSDGGVTDTKAAELAGDLKVGVAALLSEVGAAFEMALTTGEAGAVPVEGVKRLTALLDSHEDEEPDEDLDDEAVEADPLAGKTGMPLAEFNKLLIAAGRKPVGVN